MGTRVLLDEHGSNTGDHERIRLLKPTGYAVPYPHGVGDATILTERLRLRRWTTDDAEAAQLIYGDPEVTSWLAPALAAVPDITAMRALLQRWVAADARIVPPAGRWAVEALDDGRLVGGVVLLPMPPGDEDLELGWLLSKHERGRGYATEAGRAVARWGFEHGMPELFAVSRPHNSPAIRVAKRLGMQWVGETTKYYDLLLQVYRVRPAELL
jgi:RimJ/RimL family protein N-acetyltransferase